MTQSHVTFPTRAVSKTVPGTLLAALRILCGTERVVSQQYCAACTSFCGGTVTSTPAQTPHGPGVDVPGDYTGILKGLLS